MNLVDTIGKTRCKQYFFNNKSKFSYSEDDRESTTHMNTEKEFGRRGYRDFTVHTYKATINGVEITYMYGSQTGMSNRGRRTPVIRTVLALLCSDETLAKQIEEETK